MARVASPAFLCRLLLPELSHLYFFVDCQSCLNCTSLLITRVASPALLCWLPELPYLHFFDCQSCFTCISLLNARDALPALLCWLLLPELSHFRFFTDCQSCLTCTSLLIARVASPAIVCWLPELPHLPFFADYYCQSCLTYTSLPIARVASSAVKCDRLALPALRHWLPHLHSILIFRVSYPHFFTNCLNCLTCTSILIVRVALPALLYWLPESLTCTITTQIIQLGYPLKKQVMTDEAQPCLNHTNIKLRILSYSIISKSYSKTSIWSFLTYIWPNLCFSDFFTWQFLPWMICSASNWRPWIERSWWSNCKPHPRSCCCISASLEMSEIL